MYYTSGTFDSLFTAIELDIGRSLENIFTDMIRILFGFTIFNYSEKLKPDVYFYF